MRYQSQPVNKAKGHPSSGGLLGGGGGGGVMGGAGGITGGLGGNPDDDIAFSANSRYFIQGGGGFSILLANMVSVMGGQVLTDPVDVGR